jgi:tetratricopeptide (TPR) repeat protein
MRKSFLIATVIGGLFVAGVCMTWTINLLRQRTANRQPPGNMTEAESDPDRARIKATVDKRFWEASTEYERGVSILDNGLYSKEAYEKAEPHFLAAVSKLNSLIKENPSNHLYFSSRGRCCVALRKYEEAVSDLRTATKLNPASHYEWDLLAGILEDMGRHKESAEAWQGGLTACEAGSQTMDTPRPTFYYWHQAVAYAKAMEGEKAVAALKKLRAIDPVALGKLFEKEKELFKDIRKQLESDNGNS